MDILSSHANRFRYLKAVLLLFFVGGLFYVCSFIIAIHIVGSIDRTDNADVIVVLGAGIRRDGRAGWALTRRAVQGATLWKQGVADTVLCTGAQAEGYPRSEASVCREILLREGVDPSAILLEESSRSTEENAIYSQYILEDFGYESVVLVSDSYHILRAEWLFRDRGIMAYTSPIPASRINRPIFYPYSLMREFLAFHWYIAKSALNIPVTHIYGV